MDNVKLELYPTIKQALESLNTGECLYTNIGLIYNPLKFYCVRNGKTYKVVRVERSKSSEEIEKFISNFIKNMERYVPEWNDLDFIKNDPSNLIEETKAIYSYSKEDIYWIYFFRMKDIDEFRKDIVSSIRENAGAFPEPVEEAALLGLGEEFDKYQKNEFLSIGVFKAPYSVNNYWANSEVVKRIIESSLVRKEWEKEDWEEEVVKKMKVEEIIETIRVPLLVGGLYNKEEAILTIFDKPIESLDERMGKRIVGRIWESNGLVNIDVVDINELGRLLISKPFKSIEKFYPEVIGKIVIYIGQEVKSLVAIPILKLVDKEKDFYEVRFLVMVKSKILGKNTFWSETVGYEEYSSGSGKYRIHSNEDFSMTVKDTRKSDLRFIEERGNLDSGKKMVILNLQSRFNVEVLSKDSEFSETLPKIKRIHYTPDFKDEKIVALFDIDNLGNVNIEKYEKTKIVEGKEKLVVEILAPEDVEKCGFSKIKNEYRKEIERDMRKIIGLIEDLEKNEKSQERKVRLKIGKMLVKKSEDLLKGKLGVKVNCKEYDGTIRQLTYEATSGKGDEKKIEFKKDITEAIKEIQIRAARESKVAKTMLGYARFLSLLNEDPRNLELCYERTIGKKNIGLINLGNIDKDLYYVRKVKEVLETSFKEYLENLKMKNKSDVIPPYVKNWSTGIAASVLSISSRSLLELEEVIPAFLLKGEERLSREEMERIYSTLIKNVYMGCYYFDHRTKSWIKKKQDRGGKYCRKDRVKKLIEKTVAIDMEMTLSEVVKIEISGYYYGEQEVKAALTDFATSYVENKMLFYLKTGSEGKLLEVVTY